jgi:hypothetical protein
MRRDHSGSAEAVMNSRIEPGWWGPAGLFLATLSFGSLAGPAKPGEGQVLLEASAEIQGGTSAGAYKASGIGSCKHNAKAQPIEWSVAYGSGDGSGLRVLQLSVAGLSSGGSDQLVLLLVAGTGFTNIGTMRGATQAGKGHVTMTESGKGPVHFSVRGTSEEGATVLVEIECHSSTSG